MEITLDEASYNIINDNKDTLLTPEAHKVAYLDVLNRMQPMMDKESRVIWTLTAK